MAGSGSVLPTKTAAKNSNAVNTPLSRVGIGVGVGAMGINMSVATNLNRHMNVRGTGNVFNYSVNNISTNGFNIGAKLKFASAGAALDFYPFPTHGFRLSPGMILYNENGISASGTIAQGDSINLNDQDYYSWTSDPMQATASVGFNTNKKAFSMTTGWGNMIARKGGHFSFPLEIGAAFTGVPTVGVNLTGGACTSATAQSSANCADLSGNATLAQEVHTNLQDQIAKWKSDLDPFKVYPIFSMGMSYNFRIRPSKSQ